MSKMREIGRTLKTEQNLTAGEVAWLIVVAKAILRAFSWGEGEPMRDLADDLDVSPTTFYRLLRLAVQALVLVCRRKQSVERMVDCGRELQGRLTQVKAAYEKAQTEVERLTEKLIESQAQAKGLQSERAQLKVSLNRLIVVLKMSGRCTVRSIVEVFEYGFGVHVSVGYVQGIIAQAGANARPVLERLWQAMPFSGAVSIDEVCIKELGSKIWGVVIVDPLSGLIWRLQRCGDRGKDAIGGVIQEFAQAGFAERVRLCLTDMYTGYLEPVKTHLSKAVHQFCWFHINCFHIGATVRRAKRAYERAVETLVTFDKKHAGPLSDTGQQKRRDLVTARDRTLCYWIGAQRFQRLLIQLLWLSSLDAATKRLDQLIRVASTVQNPYVKTMAEFLVNHRAGLLVFYTCLESSQHLLQRLSRSQHKWVPLIKRWALPITSNAAEHVFRYLRRYTKQMDHFGTDKATQRFFDLFVLYYNLRTLRAGKREGNSLLASAHVNVEKLFGTDDPYSMLGFPPASSFSLAKSVQSGSG